MDDTCVLLFSGGRDSTLAAVRLAKKFERLVLITVISPHMTGLDRVRSRIEELRFALVPELWWMLMPEPTTFRHARSNENSGCISCHFGYFGVASKIAKQLQCRSLACGFVQYQNHWVEQTPYAVERLSNFLQERNQQLLLPVAGISSREEAEAELKSCGLSTQSLELKCLRQRPDPGLVGSALFSAVDAWTEALRAMLGVNASSDQPIEQISICRAGAQ